MVLSVSDLNSQIKALVETTFLSIQIEGEVSNCIRHSSGHYYFSLKDEHSSIRCVLFRGNVKNGLNFELKNEQKILITGSISVYVPRGEYQIICQKIELSGHGALEFEALKKKLEAKGFFDASHKVLLPKMPKKIAIITSATGAAIQDILRVAQERWGILKITLFDTLVQGKSAAQNIANQIKLADSYFGTPSAFDVIVIGRGGGSLEDLWAFNEEIVAQAVFDCKTPIVSAVGHEIDYVISDFVADLRAPTPSAAMEMILPDKDTWNLMLDDYANALDTRIKSLLSKLKSQLEHYEFFLSQYDIQNRLELQKKSLLNLSKTFNFKVKQFFDIKMRQIPLAKDFLNAGSLFFNLKRQELRELEMILKERDFSKISQNGYAQIFYQGKVAMLENLKEEDEIEILNTKTRVCAKVNRVTKL